MNFKGQVGFRTRRLKDITGENSIQQCKGAINTGYSTTNNKEGSILLQHKVPEKLMMEKDFFLNGKLARGLTHV